MKKKRKKEEQKQIDNFKFDNFMCNGHSTDVDRCKYNEYKKLINKYENKWESGGF